jgi:hypothetical protein
MVAVTLGRFGRTPPAPPGKMYVRDPAAGWAHSIVEAVQRHKDAEAVVPQHLVALAAALPAELPDIVVLVDDDFGVPPPPFASAQPLTPEPEAVPDEQPSLWDEEEATEIDLEGWTVPELKDALAQLGVDYPASARKHELIALLQEAQE